MSESFFRIKLPMEDLFAVAILSRRRRRVWNSISVENGTKCELLIQCLEEVRKKKRKEKEKERKKHMQGSLSNGFPNRKLRFPNLISNISRPYEPPHLKLTSDKIKGRDFSLSVINFFTFSSCFKFDSKFI